MKKSLSLSLLACVAMIHLPTASMPAGGMDALMAAYSRAKARRAASSFTVAKAKAAVQEFDALHVAAGADGFDWARNARAALGRQLTAYDAAFQLGGGGQAAADTAIAAMKPFYGVVSMAIRTTAESRGIELATDAALAGVADQDDKEFLKRIAADKVARAYSTDPMRPGKLTRTASSDDLTAWMTESVAALGAVGGANVRNAEALLKQLDNGFSIANIQGTVALKLALDDDRVRGLLGVADAADKAQLIKAQFAKLVALDAANVAANAGAHAAGERYTHDAINLQTRNGNLVAGLVAFANGDSLDPGRNGVLDLIQTGLRRNIGTTAIGADGKIANFRDKLHADLGIAVDANVWDIPTDECVLAIAGLINAYNVNEWEEETYEFAQGCARTILANMMYDAAAPAAPAVVAAP